MGNNRITSKWHKQPRYASCLLLTAALVFFNNPRAEAQVLYGSIVGSVTDSTGASVPGAAIKVTQSETNESREVSTNDAGGYTLSTVPPGTYEVSIAKPGFRTYTAQKVQVTSNTVVRVDASLEVGTQTDTVSVTAESAALQTDRADVHGEFTTQAIINLPQPTRTYQGVLALMPGIAPPTASSGGTNNPSKSMQITANGTSRNGVTVRIDGVTDTNPWVQFFSTYVPSMEAIETVNVVTGSADAEQGMVNGAAINVQTKSGTNAVHGSLYEYNETSALKARPFFLPANQGIPKLVDNNLGGTIGGHFIRNKLFYFGSYEGDFISQGSSTLATVPTDAIRKGDMSGSSTPIYDPATGSANGMGRTPFPGNIIPANRLSSITQKLVALVPQPNLPGLTSNYYVNTGITNRLHKIDTKFDWNAGSKLKLSGRVGDQPYNLIQATVFGNILGGANNHIQNGSVFATAVSATYIASPAFIVDATWGMTRAHQLLSPPLTDQKYGSDVLGIPGTNLGTLPHAGGMPQFNVSSYSGYGYAYPPLEYNDPIFQYTVNATWVKGSHNVRFGLDLSRQHMNHFEVAPTNFSFNGGATALNATGAPSPNQFNSYADFLLGLSQSYGNSFQTVPTITLRTWEYSLYVRDQWQVSRKLTVSYGVRWEYYPVPTRADRGIERYDFDTNTYLICGVGSTPTDCGIHVKKDLFSPRIGIAYRPTETFVIRAGFSLNPEQINMYRDGISSYPIRTDFNASGASSYTPVGPLSAGIPILPTPDISGGKVALPPGATFTTDPKNFIRGYTESWNFTLQKELFKGWIAQAGYVGTHSVHQHTRYNVNYGLPGLGAASQPFFKFGTTGAETVILPAEAMRYNSFQSSLERRFANGFMMQAAYTRSKWMGLCCDDSGDGGLAIPIPAYQLLNRSLMGGDRPNNFRMSAIYELPFGKGKKMLSNNRLASAVAGGWQLNAIFSKYSGTPFSVTASGTSLNAPGSTQRADQVKPNLAILGAVGSWFDPLAFAPVTGARFGTAGFNTVRGPGVTNLDVSLFRTFKVTERWAVQFRADALNATNTPHFSNPGTNVSNLQLNGDGSIRSLGGYTQITSVSAPSRTIDERFFRLGARISF